jgi:hypothetical protein
MATIRIEYDYDIHTRFCDLPLSLVWQDNVNRWAIVIYGKVVYFRSHQTKHALMCKIHEQDKVSVLKNILCSLMNMSFL